VDSNFVTSCSSYLAVCGRFSKIFDGGATKFNLTRASFTSISR
jgi:hypothetical protein